MSRSDHHQQLLPNQKKQEIIDPESLQSETDDEEREKVEEKIHDEAGADHRNEIPERSIKIDDENETGEAAASHEESPEDDEDGFKTPTSSDHKIPAITSCPPAPKKLRPPPSKLKRKAAAASSSIQLEEVESIFSPPIADEQDDAQRHKIKKARTTESSDD